MTTISAEEAELGQSSNTKPSLFEIDQTIARRFEKENISLILEFQERFSMESFMAFSKREFLMRNEFTILALVTYCIEPLKDAFMEDLSEKLYLKSPEYTFLSLKSAGYYSGYTAIPEGIIHHPDSEHMDRVMRKIFTPEEFAHIGEAVKDLLVKFPTEVLSVCRWMKDHVDSESSQKDSLVDFVKTLREANFEHNNTKVSVASEKALNSVMGAGSHNLWLLEKKKQAGLLTPSQQFMLTIQRILTYLDVLFYAGYYSLITYDPQEMRFVG